MYLYKQLLIYWLKFSTDLLNSTLQKLALDCDKQLDSGIDLNQFRFAMG